MEKVVHAVFPRSAGRQDSLTYMVCRDRQCLLLLPTSTRLTRNNLGLELHAGYCNVEAKGGTPRVPGYRPRLDRCLLTNQHPLGRRRGVICVTAAGRHGVLANTPALSVGRPGAWSGDGLEMIWG